MLERLIQIDIWAGGLATHACEALGHGADTPTCFGLLLFCFISPVKGPHVVSTLVGLVVFGIYATTCILELPVRVNTLLCHSFHIGYEFNYLNMRQKH